MPHVYPDPCLFPNVSVRVDARVMQFSSPRANHWRLRTAATRLTPGDEALPTKRPHMQGRDFTDGQGDGQLSGAA